MPGINRIKFINSLKQKKNRRHHQLFILEGEKMIDELMESRLSIHSVYATLQWFSERGLVPYNVGKTVNQKGSGLKNTYNSQINPSQSQGRIGYNHDADKTKRGDPKKKSGKSIQNMAERDGFPLYEIKESELIRISSLKTPNKVLALASIPYYTLYPAAFRDSITLVIDNLQDPGNLGTLIRSADWFGVENIILSKNSAEITSPKVVQSTMGSILRIRFYYLDLQTFLKSPEMNDIPVFGAFTEGSNIYSVELPERGLIVLGNESGGISPGVEKLIKSKISIPSFRHKAGSAESLNLAVAGSIILSEFRRRKS